MLTNYKPIFCSQDSITLNEVIETATADFEFDAVCLGEPVVFVNKSTTGGISQLNHWWDFDEDGVNDDSNENPTKLYAQAGNHNVRLIVQKAPRLQNRKIF